MKILVCLVSGQHVPNLLTVHEILPDRLMLLVTGKMKPAATSFVEALKYGNLDYSNSKRCDCIPLKDPALIEETKAALREAYQSSQREYPDAWWTVNITGGTKPMCIGAYEFCKDHGLRMLYVLEQDQSRALDFSGGDDLKLHYKIPMEEFLAGYSFKIQNRGLIDEAKVRAYRWFPLATLMMARSDIPSVRAFLRRIHGIAQRENMGEGEGLDLTASDQLFLDDGEVRKEIVDCLGLRYEGEYIIGRLDSHALHLLRGGWLEVFVWGLLEKFEGKTIWDLFPGVCVEKTNQALENDWDVAFMRDQSLYIVECKSSNVDDHPGRDRREIAQEMKGGDVLLRIEANRRQLGAVRVRSYLATNYRRILEQKTGRVKKSIADRAKHYECEIITGKDLRKLAEMELKGYPGLKEEIARVFKLNPVVGI